MSAASVYFLDAVCIDPDWLYVATQLEDLDPHETSHTRMSVLDLTQSSWWACHDYEDTIVSVHAYRLPKEDLPDGSRYAALGMHGTVHFNERNEPTFKEVIPGAGMTEGNFGGLLTHIRLIDGQLWACGQHGQVYRRMGRDDWQPADEGIRVHLNPSDHAQDVEGLLDRMNAAPMLSCMDGASSDDVYVVGLGGYMAHFDGTAWTRIDLPVDEHLEWVRCYGPEEVWVCGYKGTLLRGNARDGFNRLNGSNDQQTFVCLTKFNESVYLCAEEGLFVWNGKSIMQVRTSLQPELQDAWRVDQVDGVLWSVGVTDIARFDGKIWLRVEHPDNERIGP
ncbi:hypothetical protein [Roseateles depolymerans]|uniref:hypothetical protein n=1 Tax=Roseateles depolymerans TaxID=76731 RepID=UPI0011C040A3|nr:hypothetical protein [Roseateles depolymerans]